MSAEQTPTLSIVIPTYEKLIGMLRDLKPLLPNIAHAIDASVDKLEEYMAKARSTRMYVLAMCECLPPFSSSCAESHIVINPQIKLQHAEAHWTSDESSKAKTWVKEAVRHSHCI